MSLLVEVPYEVAAFRVGLEAAITRDLGQRESMSLRKRSNQQVVVAAPSSVASWSVADLAELYSAQRPTLTAQAKRILKSDADAAEIVQEAFLKFILAAPELDSADRALAYLRTTVNNLCFNHLRARGRKPEVVAIDSESTAMILDELSFSTHIPFDAALASAEDAAVVRGALSRLSADQRTALVMWEVEGRSTEEIAAALGTTPANVRHVVARSRTSFVRVLNEWVIDEESGATALEFLSDTYKRAAVLAKKSSGAALSLVLIFVAFLGYSSFNHKVSVKPVSSITSVTGEVKLPGKLAAAAPTLATPNLAAVSPVKPTASSSGAAPVLISKLATLAPTVDAKIAPITYAGVDRQGVPTGFTVTDLSGDSGKVIIGTPAPYSTIDGISLTAPVVSYDPKAVNVLINQVITVDGSGTTYTPTVSVSMNGNWVELNTSAISTNITRLANGNYLVDSTMVISGPVDAGVVFPVSQGVDVATVPTSISARLVLSPGKTSILAESIKVGAIGAKVGPVK